jgi:hypothetical protein
MSRSLRQSPTMDTPWLEHLTWLTWRMASYATLNLIDDAAMLAILFC